jgi:hypothetical protein
MQGKGKPSLGKPVLPRFIIYLKFSSISSSILPEKSGKTFSIFPVSISFLNITGICVCPIKQIFFSSFSNSSSVLTDVEGVIIDGKVVREIKIGEIDKIIEKIGPGMNRKVLMAKKAIEEGVKRIIISSGTIENPVKNALEGKGTVIVKE